MGWVGWEVGMSGLPVQAAKRALKAKFSYAKNLDDSPFFGEDLKSVLVTYQAKKNASGYEPRLRMDGILDYATKVALGMIHRPAPGVVGTLYTVQGTGVDMWTGYPADTARAVLDRWTFQPVGNYPAAVFPMGPSVQQGIAELKSLIRSRPGKFALAGYSQGAIVTSMVYKHDLLNPAGELHDRLHDLVAGVTWGNPCREAGVANGNRFAGWPIPEGRGISDDRLENTPPWWFDFAHGENSEWGRDIYTDVPLNSTGDDMTAIYRIIQDVSGFVGPNSLVEQLTEAAQDPVVNVPNMFQAIYYGGQFFLGYNPATLPHIDYAIEPAVAYLKSIQN